MADQVMASCFVSKLQHYIELTADEQEAVSNYEKTERVVEGQCDVYREGSAATELFVVKSGWLCNYRFTERGQRQIVQVRHPGDLCGMHEMMLPRRCSSLLALEDCVICPLPKDAVRRLLGKAPRVALLIQALATLDQAILIDSLQAIARTSAMERVMHLLLTLYHRLRMTNLSMNLEFRLPMNQSVIGDMMGLTNVSVSKAMSELERLGHIKRRAGRVTLLQLDQSIRLIGFSNRYDDVDLGWLSDSDPGQFDK